jgi:hypothetical protein
MGVYLHADLHCTDRCYHSFILGSSVSSLVLQRIHLILIFIQVVPFNWKQISLRSDHWAVHSNIWPRDDSWSIGIEQRNIIERDVRFV